MTFNFEKYKEAKREYLVKRINRLIIPYAIAGIAFYLLWLIETPFYGMIVPWYNLLFGLAYGNNTCTWLAFDGPLWFLPALFCAELIFLVAMASSRRGIVQPFLFVGLGLLGVAIGHFLSLPWGLDIALVAQVFIFAGFILKGRRLWNKEKTSLDTWMLPLSLIVLAFSIVTNGFVNINGRHYNNFIVFYIGGLAGSINVLSFCRILARIGLPKLIRRTIDSLGRSR